MTNFVFSRRALQRAIDRLVGVLSREQLTAIVERLNRAGDQRLPAMWEVVMLDALATEAPLTHEADLPNGRRPDFELAVPASDGSPLRVIGDITTVSDAGLHEQNPVDLLTEELTRLARKHGLNPGHFGYDVGGGRRGPYQKARMKLSLPGRNELRSIFRAEVEPWIKRLAASRPRKDRVKYSAGEVAFTLIYNTGQPGMTGTHLSYGVAVSLTKNPLSGALKAKVPQLRAAPPDAIRLMIACDGGCSLLRPSDVHALGTFTAREVATDFLRQNSTIDFVLLVTVKEGRLTPGVPLTFQMKYDLLAAPPKDRSPRSTEAALSAITRLLSRAKAHIPNPVLSPENAMRLCREPGPGPDRHGGYVSKGNRIRISSRALHRLLAGEVSSEEFLASHDWDGNWPNPFQAARAEGRMIDSITVECGGDRDDDWLEFTFGSPDPATGPFRIPDDSKGDDDTA